MYTDHIRHSVACWIGVFVWLLSGCGTADVAFPMPAKGYDDRRIEYPKAPPLSSPTAHREPNSVVIEIAKVDFANRPATPQAVENTMSAKVSQQLCFEGELVVPPPVEAGVMMIVECFQVVQSKAIGRLSGVPEERMSRAAGATGLGITRHLGEGRLDYRIQFPAPKTAGRYEFDVKALYVPQSSVPHVIATGTIEVQ